MPETRVEKYKSYREEIQSSFVEENPTSKKTSQRVEELLNGKKDNPSLSINQMIDAYDIYDKGQTKISNPLLGKAKKHKQYVWFCIIGIVLLTTIVVLLGLKTFGGI